MLLVSTLLPKQVRQVVAVLLQVRQDPVQSNYAPIQIAVLLSWYPLLHVQVFVIISNCLKVMVLSQLRQLLDDGPLQL